MKAFLEKYWRRLRCTEKDAVRYVRQQCIGIASHYQHKNALDMLRSAQLVYDWTESGVLPPEPQPEDASGSSIVPLRKPQA